MEHKIRLFGALLISLLPSSGLRCFCYRWFYGYSISKVKLGFGTLIVVREASLEGCTIGRFNKFIGPMCVSVGNGADIETHNVFDCGEWAADAQHAARYDRKLTIESDVRITNYHYFDVAGRLFIGKGSWVAGRGSQFWTHGVNTSDRNVSIGKGSYIGSAVRFAPGASVGDNVIVGIGSVVTKPLTGENALVAGFPAEVIREGRGWTRQETGR